MGYYRSEVHGELIAEIIVTLIEYIIRYIIDEKREEKGISPKFKQDIGSISGRNMNFICIYRAELENIKAMRERAENEKRSKYVWYDKNAEMEDLFEKKYRIDLEKKK